MLYNRREDVTIINDNRGQQWTKVKNFYKLPCKTYPIPDGNVFELNINVKIKKSLTL